MGPLPLPEAFPSGKPASYHRRPTTNRHLLCLLLLLAATISPAADAASLPLPHSFLHAACTSARHPDLCVSSISSSPSLLNSISSHKDVILASLNLTRASVLLSLSGAHHLSTTRPNLTARERTALNDCIELFGQTLDELWRADADLRSYPPSPAAGASSSKTLSLHAADIMVMVTAAKTNQESCADGFSHATADRDLREKIYKGLAYVEHLCGNALGMIRNLTDADVAAEAAVERRGLAELGEHGFPEWISEGDRRQLLDATVTADVTVAADGSGKYKTIGEAVAAAPEKSGRRYVIRIKAGTYRENVEVPKKKTNIMFFGDGRANTVITGSRNVVDGWTTFRSATLAVVGERFLARGLRIENTAGTAKHQAVALRVGSDFSAFYDCDIIGHQDTLYVHSLRQFFRGCRVQGTVDFIFGNAAAVLQDCDIQARLPGANQKNMVTAQGRTDPNEPTGIVLQSCRIAAAADLAASKSSFSTYLGRPWKEFSRTVVMESVISDVIHPDGWYEWAGKFALDTLFYGEYRNTGPGSGTANRVKWKGYRVISSTTEAQQFTVQKFIEGSAWLGSTGFPFSAGL